MHQFDEFKWLGGRFKSSFVYSKMSKTFISEEMKDNNGMLRHAYCQYFEVWKLFPVMAIS